VIARAEHEQRQLVGADLAIAAELIVPVAEAQVAAEQPDDGPEVRVAARDRDRAVAGERRRHHAARVEEAHVDGGVNIVAGRGARLRRDEARDRPPVARGIAARIEVEAVEEIGVDHRRAEREVEQRGHTQIVEHEGRVARVRAADGVDGRRPRDGGDARQRLEGAERIAHRAGRAQELGALEAHLRLARGRAHDGLVGERAVARGQTHDERRGIRARVALDERDLEARRLHGDVVFAARHVGGEAALIVGVGDGSDVDHDGRADDGPPAATREHAALEPVDLRRLGRGDGVVCRGVGRRGSVGGRASVGRGRRISRISRISGVRRARVAREAEQRRDREQRRRHGNVVVQRPS
jgi:hypothetical protein